MEPIIRFEHVSKSFGDQAVLRDLSLDIRPGEFLTIIGRSGCAGQENPAGGRQRGRGGNQRDHELCQRF